jgi:hypothetical protein
MPRDGLSGAGHGPRPWQRRTRQRPRYGLDFRVRAARRVVQLMRLTLFLVVDSAAGMSAVVAHHFSGIGDSARNLRGLS